MVVGRGRSRAGQRRRCSRCAALLGSCVRRGFGGVQSRYVPRGFGRGCGGVWASSRCGQRSPSRHAFFCAGVIRLLVRTGGKQQRAARRGHVGVSGGGGENHCAVGQLGVTPPPERLHQVVAPDARRTLKASPRDYRDSLARGQRGDNREQDRVCRAEAWRVGCAHV